MSWLWDLVETPTDATFYAVIGALLVALAVTEAVALRRAR